MIDVLTEDELAAAATQDALVNCLAYVLGRTLERDGLAAATIEAVTDRLMTIAPTGSFAMRIPEAQVRRHKDLLRQNVLALVDMAKEEMKMTESADRPETPSRH